MDLLGDIFSAIRMRGSVYFRAQLHAPWAVGMPRLGRGVRFHLALEGDCYVGVEGAAEPVRLETGDMVVIPHGAPHVLSDRPGRRPVSVDELVRRSGYTGAGVLVHNERSSGGGRADAELVCGHLQFEEPARHPLLDDLPPSLVVRSADSLDWGCFGRAMDLIRYEIESDLHGHSAVVNRLAEILLIQAIRIHLQRSGRGHRYLAALRDSGLSRALAAIHREVDRAWTVEMLAFEAGMSRARFAARFRQTVGLGPLAYLTEWRMHSAARLLRNSDMTLAAIASRVGYESERALARAFRRVYETSPGRYRDGLRNAA